MDKNKHVAKRVGNVAINARLSTEKELKRSVITQDNFLTNDENKIIENKEE